MDADRTRAAWRIPPLAFIAVAFFLPFVRSCGAVETPLSRLQPEPDVLQSGIWVIPPFLAAAGLAILFAIVVVRPALRDGAGLAALLGLVGWAVSVPLLCLQMMAGGATGDDRLLVFWTLGAALPASVTVYLAAVRAGWRRLDWLVATYVLLTIGSPVTFLLGAGDAILVGGWIYIASVGALGAIAIESLVRRRRA